MGIAVLPSDLEQFVAEVVAVGEVRDRSEAMAAGIELLRERRAARADFLQTLEEAEAAAAGAACPDLQAVLVYVSGVFSRQPLAG